MDLVRSIFPTVSICSRSGIEEVEGDAISAIYRSILESRTGRG